MKINLSDYWIDKNIDGNMYQVVQIGSQIWTTKNLSTTKFNTGMYGGLYDPVKNMVDVYGEDGNFNLLIVRPEIDNVRINNSSDVVNYLADVYRRNKNHYHFCINI